MHIKTGSGYDLFLLFNVANVLFEFVNNVKAILNKHNNLCPAATWGIFLSQKPAVALSITSTQLNFQMN